MDAASLRLLFRLSLAVVVLVFSVAGIAAGVRLPLGRGGRALPVLALFGSVVAILLILGRLRRRGQPAGPPPPTPLVRRGIRHARRAAKCARARASAAGHRRRRAARVREAERAALTASRGDGRLAPARIGKAADALFRLVHLALAERDPERLAALMSPALLADWERTLDGDPGEQRAGAQVLGDVNVDLVGLTVTSAGPATVVVLIEAELRVATSARHGVGAAADAAPRSERLCQYWTLGLDDGPFRVEAIEQRREGDHHLTEPIVVPGAR